MTLDLVYRCLLTHCPCGCSLTIFFPTGLLPSPVDQALRTSLLVLFYLAELDMTRLNSYSRSVWLAVRLPSLPFIFAFVQQ
jgi:hypothetical protein